MGLSLVKKPTSCRLSDTANATYSISNTGYGNALLSGGSGLTSGTKILIYNSLDSYNGFWLITSAPGGFTLSRYSGAANLEFTQTASKITIYPCLNTVEWSSVHLPITYKLLSTLWPTNSIDTIQAIVGFANNNGYVRITLGGSIDINELDWLDIQATTVDALDGPFQVLTKHSNTQYTINAPYSLASSAYTYAVATAQKYYNNYLAKVRIYGGLQSGHLWQSLKPHELITTEDLTPEDDNTIVVNVNEKLKEKIQILKNRPNYDSFPYDLDRFCQFYIEFAESYDESDGAEVSTNVEAYTTDTLNGWAIDAKLEFKNRYSGFMSEYVYADSSHLAKFLTMAEGSLFSGFYFDLSFINTAAVKILYQQVLIQDINENTLSTAYVPIDDDLVSKGVVRVPITVGSGVFEKITIYNSVKMLNVSNWTESVGGWAAVDTSATQGQWTKATILSGTNFTGRLAVVMPAGAKIGLISATMSWTTSRSFSFILRTSSGQVLDTDTNSGTSASVSQSNPSGVLLTSAITYIEITMTSFSGTSTSAQVNLFLVGDPLGASIPITEQKCLNIDSACYDNSMYLTWKNALGGFDYWLFNAPQGREHNINIVSTQEKTKNIFPTWDESYNEFADTIRQETSRESRKEFTVISQNLTEDQIEFISGIKTSSLVQQMTSKYDRRTVILDRNSFTKRTDGDKRFTIEFSLRYTNDIASQSL